MSQLDESGRGVYTGRSSEAELQPGDPDGPTLEKAIRNAYDKGRVGKPSGHRAFRVVEIRVEGDNPPTDYIVELIDHG